MTIRQGILLPVVLLSLGCGSSTVSPSCDFLADPTFVTGSVASTETALEIRCSYYGSLTEKKDATTIMRVFADPHPFVGTTIEVYVLKSGGGYLYRKEITITDDRPVRVVVPPGFAYSYRVLSFPPPLDGLLSSRALNSPGGGGAGGNYFPLLGGNGGTTDVRKEGTTGRLHLRVVTNLNWDVIFQRANDLSCSSSFL